MAERKTMGDALAMSTEKLAFIQHGTKPKEKTDELQPSEDPHDNDLNSFPHEAPDAEFGHVNVEANRSRSTWTEPTRAM